MFTNTHTPQFTLYVENELQFCFTYINIAVLLSLIVMHIDYTLLMCVFRFIRVCAQLEMNPDVQDRMILRLNADCHILRCRRQPIAAVGEM